MSDNNKEQQKIECQKGYYRCSERRSIHSFVSASLFMIAIGWLVLALLKGNLPQVSEPANNVEDVSLANQFRNIYVYLFVLPCVLHWIRIYFSFIKIDEDPIFYKTTLKDLKNWKKNVEWFLRVFMLITLVWFVQNTSIHNEETEKTVFLKFYFSPIVCLYLFLCAWDVFLFICVPINISLKHPVNSYKQLGNSGEIGKVSKDRLKWVLNDTLGLVMSVVMILIEADILTKENMLYVSAGISAMGVIALGLIGGDLLFNNKKYKDCLNKSLFPNYKKIVCTNPCPLNV